MKKTRIAFSAGHNVYLMTGGKYYFDSGAVSQPYVEADITKRTVATLMKLFTAGKNKDKFEVKDVTPYERRFASSKAHHQYRTREADNWKADILVDVHTNAGGGTGVEVFIYKLNNKIHSEAQAICNIISKDLGLRNRGVKANKALYTVRLGRAPAMIVEGGFTDNHNDMAKLSPQKYAESIAKGLGADINIQDSKPIKHKPLYRVRKDKNNPKTQRGAYENLENAIEQVERLNKGGAIGYKVWNEEGKQMYPEKKHWAEKHFKNLKDKGVEINEKRFNDKITRGEAMALIDRALELVEKQK